MKVSENEKEKMKRLTTRALFFTNLAYILADIAKYMMVNAEDVLSKMHKSFDREEKRKFGVACESARRAKTALINAAQPIYDIKKSEEAGEESLFMTEVIIALIDRTLSTEEGRKITMQHIKMLPSRMHIDEWLYGPTIIKEDMEKSEYVEKIQDLARVKNRALEYNSKEVNKVKEKYIATNCPIKVGDNVRLGSTVGVIESLDANERGEFFGRWRKQKKDGELYKEAYVIRTTEFINLKKV